MLLVKGQFVLANQQFSVYRKRIAGGVLDALFGHHVGLLVLLVELIRVLVHVDHPDVQRSEEQQLRVVVRVEDAEPHRLARVEPEHDVPSEQSLRCPHCHLSDLVVRQQPRHRSAGDDVPRAHLLHVLLLLGEEDQADLLRHEVHDHEDAGALRSSLDGARDDRLAALPLGDVLGEHEAGVDGR